MTDQGDTEDLTLNCSISSLCFPCCGMGGPRCAMTAPLPSSKARDQRLGRATLFSCSWNWRAEKIESKRNAGLPFRMAGTAMATSVFLAIGPGKVSPTAGFPVAMAMGAAA